MVQDEKLFKDQTAQLNHSYTFELLENLYPYKVEFVPSVQDQQHQTPSSTDIDLEQTITLNHLEKRKDPPGTDEEQNMKQCLSKKKNKTGDSWEEFDNDELFVFTAEGVEPRSKVIHFKIDF